MSNRLIVVAALILLVAIGCGVDLEPTATPTLAPTGAVLGTPTRAAAISTPTPIPTPAPTATPMTTATLPAPAPTIPAPTPTPDVKVGKDIGNRALEFSVTSIDGDTYTLPDFMGERPFILYFFATW